MTRKSSGPSIEFAIVSLERLWQLVPYRHAAQDYLPQANDLQKVFDLIWKTRIEILDTRSVASKFNFDPRQASYYIEATKELGFVEQFSPDSYRLTELGSRVRESTEPVALSRFVPSVLGVPIVLRLLSLVRDSPEHRLDSRDYRRLVTEFAAGRYSGATLTRRMDSISAWLRWLENNSEFVT